MLNLIYRNAVRNRPRQFRKFGRSGWIKRAAMSRPRKPKTSRFIVDRDSNYTRAQIGKRSREFYPFVSRKRVKGLFEDKMEDWLRKHPDAVKFATGIADTAWDYGLRDVVRGHLKMRLRGKRKGYEEL